MREGDWETIPSLLRARAATGGEFLVVGDRRVSFAELDDLAARVAGGLAARGIHPGDRVAVCAPNGLEWLALFFGAARLGAAVVTLNPRYRERELDYMIAHSGARLVLSVARTAEWDFASYFESSRSRLPDLEEVVYTGEGAPPGCARFDDLAGDAARPDVAPGPGTAAMILYTSGTTGRPKGAVLTHRSMLASAAAQASHLGWDRSTASVMAMPLNHVGGITCGILSSLVSGGRVVLLPGFSPAAVLAEATRHRVGVLAGVPTMWVMMLARLHQDPKSYDLSSVRVAVVGGSILDPTLAAQVAEALPAAVLVNLYGLSESSGASVLSAPGDDLATVTRSIGVVIDGFEARVVGADGRQLPPGVPGELQLRGDCVAAGYWNLPEETAAAFLPDGWLATGDVAEVEPDGHLILHGRTKEMYISGGFNVYPAEVEAVLGAHPSVALAAGFGIGDSVYGEVGCYAVVPRAGAEPSPADLIAWCAGRLADYKVPRTIIVVDDVPLTPAGKVAKAELRARLGYSRGESS